MDPDAPVPRVKVFNWQVGAREAEAGSSATAHVRELVDRLATAYMAPEALLDPKGATEASDVFSLGGDRLPRLLGPVAGGEPGRGGPDAGGARGPAGLRRA